MTRAPKICHISTSDASSGILLKNQMRYFIDRGIETHAMASPGRYVEEVEAAGIPFHPVPMTRTISPLQDLVALQAMVPILRRERFDLIHLHTPKAVLLGTIAGVLARTPYIFRTIHGFYFNANIPPLTRAFFINMERVVNRFHHTVLSQNVEDIPTAEKKRIRRADQITLLGNGVDLTRFQPGDTPSEKTQAMREQYGIEPHHTVIGFVGRLVVQKGLRELYAAFASIADKHPRAVLLLVGDADHDKDDAILPEDHLPPALLPRVIRAGWQEKVEDFYALMDFLVLPSYREGFPRTPMEAASMGLPVIASDVRGCRQAVEENVNGLLVASRSSQELAHGLDRLLSSPELREKLGHGGREKAAREFDERQKFQIVYETYTRIFQLPLYPDVNLPQNH